MFLCCEQLPQIKHDYKYDVQGHLNSVNTVRSSFKSFLLLIHSINSVLLFTKS